VKPFWAAVILTLVSVAAMVGACAVIGSYQPARYKGVW
jgi:hypothetical protein